MSSFVKTTPAVPCCDACVLDALERAGFRYSEAFVVVSARARVSRRRRRQHVDQLSSLVQGDFVVLVSIPAAARVAGEGLPVPSPGLEVTEWDPTLESEDVTGREH